MYIRNYAGNQRKDDGNEDNNKSDTAGQRSPLQREIIMKEGDYRKVINEKVKIDFEIKKLNQDEAQIRTNLREKQLSLTRLEQDKKNLEEDLSRLKKKLNLL